MEENNDILNDWLEFKSDGKYVTVRRDSICMVKDLDNVMTDIVLKNGKDIIVDARYEDVMKMI